MLRIGNETKTQDWVLLFTEIIECFLSVVRFNASGTGNEH